MMRRRGRLPLLAPEVVQTSAMDCGPAALKAFVEGHGIPVNEGSVVVSYAIKILFLHRQDSETLDRHLISSP